jgi:teichuronic acid exporter
MDQTASFKRSVLRAVGWATGTRLIGQLANWAMTLATIRFLDPEEYGLMAMTTVIAGFLQSMSYAGLADAVVQKQRISDDDLRSMFGLILLVNGACLVLLCGLAYPAAWFYGEPRLVALLQVSSLIFISIAFKAIPRASLEKRLDLKTVSRIDLISNISSGALVLILSWAGAGVWSLLTGMVFGNFVSLAGFAYAAPYFRRPLFAFHSVSDLVRSGGLRTGENLLWYFYSSADVFIIGKLLGPHILGVYSVARYVAALPVDKLAMVIKPVAFPAFAQVQDDRAESLRYLQKSLRLLGFLCFPIFMGIAATAPQMVTVVLGPKWAEAAMPLAILAVAMTLRPVGLIIPSFLMGLGEFGASFKNTLFATILFPVAFTIGSYWGLVGVCVAWLVAYPVQLLSLLRRVALVTQTRLGGLISPLLSPLAGSLLMYVGVRAVHILLPDGVAPASTLACLVATGMIIYFGYALLFLRPLFDELLAIAR